MQLYMMQKIMFCCNIKSDFMGIQKKKIIYFKLISKIINFLVMITSIKMQVGLIIVILMD